MDNPILHQAQKHKIIKESGCKYIDATLVDLQKNKGASTLSLHISSKHIVPYDAQEDFFHDLYLSSKHSVVPCGIQAEGFLSMLGFVESDCAFNADGKCFAKKVGHDFNIETFLTLFSQAYEKLKKAEANLEKCGFLFDRDGCNSNASGTGNSHIATAKKIPKESEDDMFFYKLVRMIPEEDVMGWVTHCRPKHPPLSPEIQGVFQFLRLNKFQECPEYEFESCYWHRIRDQRDFKNDNRIDDSENATHERFDAHAQNFSPGIKGLLSANADIKKIGLDFLPSRKPDQTKEGLGDLKEFDVAISFAGPQRKYAEDLASILKNAGYSVFYDDFYKEDLWGKNLADILDEIFRKRSRYYCVIFVSKEYGERTWTNHERKSAQARALIEKDKEYILPIKVDGSDLIGILPTIGCMSIDDGIKKIALSLIKKLERRSS